MSEINLNDRTTAPAETKKILLRAAEILEGGWCTDYYSLDRAEAMIPLGLAQPAVDLFCLTGAILKAVMEYEGRPMEAGEACLIPLAKAAYTRARQAIPRDNEAAFSLTYWNDNVCQSGAEAAARLREAADALDR